MQASTNKTNNWFVRAMLISAFLVPVVVTRMSTAGFSERELHSHVEIDGINYGVFDKIDGLAEIPQNSGDNSVHKVTFRRDFVTDPSLYLWAKNVMHGRSDLKDVNVVVKDHDGEEVSRYVLRMCQPLSWTVEAANPALGGFHEKIEMAVQEIAVY